jgi:hypothetical protein
MRWKHRELPDDLVQGGFALGDLIHFVDRDYGVNLTFKQILKKVDVERFTVAVANLQERSPIRFLLALWFASYSFSL